jgi:benzoyl-CoA reductase subunit B
MATRGLELVKQDRDALQLVLIGRGQSTLREDRLTAALFDAVLDSYSRIVDCAERGDPFVATCYGNSPEVFVALDLPWYPLLLLPYLPTRQPFVSEEIDQAVVNGLGTDMCTLVRLGINNVKEGRVLEPTAFVGLLSPCDGVNMLLQAIAHDRYWRDVPVFCTDMPYSDNGLAMDSHAHELRRMVAFLEDTTGRKLDVARLRETIDESNRQYKLWMKYNELRRAVPCPHSYSMGVQAWHVAQNFMVGDPRGTEWLRELVSIAEQRVSTGSGHACDERIRLLWFDVPALWLSELTDWLRDEWGACVVMDMMGYAPHTIIDTSSEDMMFRGLARRNLYDLPMIRQVCGTVNILADDIVQIVKDYKIDCVIWPAHMGHKDGAASVGIMRRLCRDIGVPFLSLGLDLFDRRYTSTDQLKDRFSDFFTTMGLG